MTLYSTTAGMGEGRFLLHQLDDIVEYYGIVVGDDTTPQATELYIDGVEGQRLEIPTDGVLACHYTVAAWNKTDGAVDHVEWGYLYVTNDGGTTTLPATLGASNDANPIETDSATNAQAPTFAFGVNDTGDYLTASYTTSTADDEVAVNVVLFGIAYRSDGDRTFPAAKLDVVEP